MSREAVERLKGRIYNHDRSLGKQPNNREVEKKAIAVAERNDRRNASKRR